MSFASQHGTGGVLVEIDRSSNTHASDDLPRVTELGGDIALKRTAQPIEGASLETTVQSASVCRDERAFGFYQPEELPQIGLR
jgi:hypothetical protein